MKFGNRVQDTSTSVGTGNIAVSGAVAATYNLFTTLGGSTPIAVGEKFPYTISSANQTESGIGTVVSLSPFTFSRMPDFGLPPVNFNAGTKVVFSDSSAHMLQRAISDCFDIGYDLVGDFGQSNAVGPPGVALVDPYVDTADSRVFQYGCFPSDTNTYNKIVSGVDPLKFSTENGGIGPGSSFAKTYASIIPTNRRVIIIPVGEGGTSMVGGTPKWNPGSPGGLYYEQAIARANLAIAAALALYPNSRYVGTIWRQGESDGDNGVSTAAYLAAAKALIAGFRSRITGAADSWFIVQGMLPEAIAARAGYPAINAAHIQLANETRHSVFVPAKPGYDSGDHLHAVAQGNRILGCDGAGMLFQALTSTGVDNVPPTASTASVANGSPSTVSIMMSEAMDPLFTPAASAFTVSGHTVSGVLVSGSTIALTVTAQFVNGEAARTVAYVQPATNQARDLAGNQLASFAGLSITNGVLPVDVTAPTFSTALVANASPTVVQVTMSETLANIAPVPGAFTVSGGKTVTGVAIAGAVISLTCSAAYVNGDTITVAYTKPGSGNVLQDPSGNQSVSFGPVAVTNNVAAVATPVKTRFGTLALTDETGTPPDYLYKGQATYSGSAMGATPTGLAMAGDGSFQSAIVNSTAGKPFWAFNTTPGVKSVLSSDYQLFADTTEYKRIAGATGTVVTPGRLPAVGDIGRPRRVGTTLFMEVSSNGGTSWTTILSFTGVTGTLYPQIGSESTTTLSVPLAVGLA